LILRRLSPHPYAVKITVGHFLILFATSGWALFSQLGSTESLLDRARRFVSSRVAAVQAKTEQTVMERTATPRVVKGIGSEKNTFSEVPLTPVPAEAQPTATVPLAPAVTEAPAVPVVQPVPTQEKPALKPRRRKRLSARRTSARTAKVAAPVAAKTPAVRKTRAAAKTVVKDPLVGTYVSMTLKTGNVVKGILMEKSATNYKLELPGMGAFDYPATTVKAVTSAE
jgi:hypothetical protein